MLAALPARFSWIQKKITYNMAGTPPGLEYMSEGKLAGQVDISKLVSN